LPVLDWKFSMLNSRLQLGHFWVGSRGGRYGMNPEVVDIVIG
jgi:hypothetical protein